MKRFKELFFVLLGNALLATSVVVFILPNNILSGGVAGITVLLKPFISFSEKWIVLIINGSFFILGAVLLGKDFTRVTFLSSVIYSAMIIIAGDLFPPVDIDPLMAAIYGGIVGGVGIGLVMRQGGSTGGTDVPPLIFNKYFHLPVDRGTMIFDALTVLLGFWIYDFNNILLGLITVFFTSFTIGKVLDFYNGIEAKNVQIISVKGPEINRLINERLDRGTTILKAEGGYTGEERMVILTVIANEQLDEMKALIDEIDPQAFVIVSEVKDVHGEGFTYEPRL